MSQVAKLHYSVVNYVTHTHARAHSNDSEFWSPLNYGKVRDWKGAGTTVCPFFTSFITVLLKLHLLSLAHSSPIQSIKDSTRYRQSAIKMSSTFKNTTDTDQVHGASAVFGACSTATFSLVSGCCLTNRIKSPFKWSTCNVFLSLWQSYTHKHNHYLNKHSLEFSQTTELSNIQQVPQDTTRISWKLRCQNASCLKREVHDRWEMLVAPPRP